MGAELTIDHTSADASLPTEADIPIVPWLDEHTGAAVRAITVAAATQHPEVAAIILFGSVARHEERPLDDDEPSDVDLLVLIDPGQGRDHLSLEEIIAIHATVGDITYRDDPPREIQIMLAVRGLADWESLFVENVARDGVLLWARGPLPAALAPVAARAVGR
jgi:predicted nucleotidyltransferase